MKSEEYAIFVDQIWTTKTSRINAERRLLRKENFIQGINIYYSCVCICFSIVTLIKEDQDLSIMTLFITIALLMAILYSNSQKNLEHARDYKKNYIDITELEFELKHIDCNDDVKIQDIEKRYCELLAANSNHLEFDYYCTVHGSTGDYRNKRWNTVKRKYYWNVIWRFCIKLITILLPVVIFLVCEVI